MIQITKGTNTDCKRLLRSTNLGFNEVSGSDGAKGKTYNMSFSVSLAEPLVNADSVKVRETLDKITRAITNFSEQEFLNINIDIVEHDSLQFKIASKTIESYETSRKLEEKVSK